MGWRAQEGTARSVEIPGPSETPQEFATRAALLPPGLEVQTHTDQMSVEQEVPVARETVVARLPILLAKLVNDVRIGGSFEIERVEEIVAGMVESIVRNPDALMWVARLREQDISSYGHGLQVSVYLTAFRPATWASPRPQRGQLSRKWACSSTSARSACRRTCSKSRSALATMSSRRSRRTSTTASRSPRRPRASNSGRDPRGSRSTTSA